LLQGPGRFIFAGMKKAINPSPTILAIESSCDETSAAVCSGGHILSNFIANQTVHERYGGVVPELASRAHMQNIVPVCDHFFDGSPENRPLLEKIYSAFPEILFIEYPFQSVFCFSKSVLSAF